MSKQPETKTVDNGTVAAKKRRDGWFVMTDESFALSTRLSVYAKTLATVLATHQRGGRYCEGVRQAQIAAECGFAFDTMRDALAELVALGIVTTIKRPPEPLRYTVHLVDKALAITDDSGNAAASITDVSGNGITGDSGNALPTTAVSLPATSVMDAARIGNALGVS